MAKPTSVSVDCMGTNLTNVSDDKLSDFVLEKFPLTPRWITQKFGLDKPSAQSFLYADVAAKGQVGVSYYPWGQLDSVDLFKSLL